MAERTITDDVEIIVVAERGAATFDRVKTALAVLPDYSSAFAHGEATFDELFMAHYGSSPTDSKHLEVTREEQAAYTLLYPMIRERFEKAHGRIQEEYWCRSMPASVVLTRKGDAVNGSAELWAISDWKQDDAPIVEHIIQLDELEVGTKFLPRRGPANVETQRLIFNAYSSALDALENRRIDKLKDQAAELKLIGGQVELARKFFKGSAQRYAQSESLRGMTAVLITLLSVAAVAATFLWVLRVDSTAIVARLLAWAAVGSVGACLSVLVRIAEKEYTPNWEATREELWTAGGLRPVVGAVLGAAIPVLVVSGLASVTTELKDATDLKTTLTYLGLALAAGFSERWAQDLIGKQPSVLGSSEEKKANAKT